MSVEHLLLSLISTDGTCAELLKRYGVTADKANVRDAGNQRRAARNRPEPLRINIVAIARYSRDLTELARKGKLDPVIGRMMRYGASYRCFQEGQRIILF